MPASTPGGSYVAEIVTSNPATGAAVNADSTPVATANRNGTDDATFTLSVTNIDTGRYKVTGTIPASYIPGDTVIVSVAATVSSVAAKAIVEKFIVDIPVIRVSTAQAGSTSTTVKLDASASATDNYYVGSLVYLTGGTGALQCRAITAYSGLTKVATVDRAWTTTPDNTTVFAILPADNPALSSNLAVNTTDTYPTNFAAMNIDSSGRLLLQPTQTGVTIPTVTTVTSGVTVTTNNDKTGYSLTVTPPTAAQVATSVWQDATAGDFTAANSIGKCLYINNVIPGAAGGLAIVGSTMTITTLPSIPNNWITAAGIAASAMNGKGDWLTPSGTLATVTTLTNLPSIPANWITAAGITAGAMNGKGDWLTPSGTLANVTTVASVTGAVPLDWGRVSNQTAVVGLTNTTIAGGGGGGGGTLDLTQAIPLTNTANTLGDCLNAARAQGFGSWNIDVPTKILSLYAPDKTTVVKSFQLDDLDSPTKRT
jgi:hypothetical protein